MPTALRMCEWWDAEECRPALPDSDAVSLCLVWMNDFDLEDKRLLATGDWRDLSRYDVFKILAV